MLFVSTYAPDKCCVSTVCQSLSRLLRPYSEVASVTRPITGFPLPAVVTWLTRDQSRVSSIAYVSSSRVITTVCELSVSRLRIWLMNWTLCLWKIEKTVSMIHPQNCCDHEDQEHRPYCWDLLLLYVQTPDTTLWWNPKTNAETRFQSLSFNCINA